MPPKKPRPRGRPRKANNKFGKWIDVQGMTRERVAAKLDVTRQYVDQLCRSVRRPDLELAMKIERLTGGDVGAGTWLKVPRHSGD